MSINREPLIKLSQSLHLTDSPDIPISIGDAVLMRSEGGWWTVCVYIGYEEDTADPYFIRSGEQYYSMMAPLEGNEERAGTEEDCIGLIDGDWMREKGLIDGTL